MNYVKYFDILGVNTAQIPCVELQGVPNTATEGVVGLLGINVLSDEHELYKCVEVKGGIYTWMPIKNGKDGVSIIKTELNDNCELIITFSNGTQTNLGVIKGEKGEKGEQADLTKIKEKNEGKYIGFWSGNTKAFEDLEITEDDTWYLLEDDTTLDEIDEALTNVETKISEFDAIVKGCETKTKAVEDAIPLIEDEIFNLRENIDKGTFFARKNFNNFNDITILLKDDTARCYYIGFGSDITLGNITIPNYSKGYFFSNGRDAMLSVVDPLGISYTVYYNASNDSFTGSRSYAFDKEWGKGYMNTFVFSTNSLYLINYYGRTFLVDVDKGVGLDVYSYIDYTIDDGQYKLTKYTFSLDSNRKMQLNKLFMTSFTPSSITGIPINSDEFLYKKLQY